MDSKTQLEAALKLGSGWIGDNPKPGTVFTHASGGTGDFEKLDPPLEVQEDGSLKPVDGKS